jgi:membrane protease YdiL (CAAX protease family)
VLGFGLVATLAARRVAEPQAVRLGLQPIPSNLIWPLLCMLPAALLVSEVDNIMRSIIPAEALNPENMPKPVQVLDLSNGLAAAQSIIVAVGIAPVVEEWLFRGVLLQGLAARLGPMLGIMMTALLYSLLHLPPVGNTGELVAPVISSFALGWLLGVVRLGTGSLLAPILLSASVSAAALLGMATVESFPIAGFNTVGDHTSALILLPAAAFVAYGVHRMLESILPQPPMPPPTSPSSESDPFDLQA